MKTNRSLAVRIVSFGLTMLAMAGMASAASFTPGNIVVYRVGTGAAGLAGTATAVLPGRYKAGRRTRTIDPAPNEQNGFFADALTSSGTSEFRRDADALQRRPLPAIARGI